MKLHKLHKGRKLSPESALTLAVLSVFYPFFIRFRGSKTSLDWAIRSFGLSENPDRRTACNRAFHKRFAGEGGDRYAWMRTWIMSGVNRNPQTGCGNLVNHVPSQAWKHGDRGAAREQGICDREFSKAKETGADHVARRSAEFAGSARGVKPAATKRRALSWCLMPACKC